MSNVRMATLCLAFGVGLAATATQSLASTRVAVYAIVDEIDFEPSSFEPQSVWISGVFVVPVPISSGEHAAPARGHLYLSLNPSNPPSTRADWEALRASAGTGQVVGFGDYWMPCSQVRSFRSEWPANANCSAEITVVETDRTRATVEPHPIPSSEGVVTMFDAGDDVCPRFGRPSVQIVADLRAAHSPGSVREKPPACVERSGFIASAELDSAFVAQTRDAEWAGASEVLILERLAASSLRLSDLRVECRYTICHIHAAFPTAEYQEATGNRLVADALNELPGFAQGGKIVPPRAAPTIDYYLQRRAPR